MLECTDIRPLLADHAAGKLPEETARQVEDHLLLCPICSAALEELRAAQYRPAPPARSLATKDPLAHAPKAPAPAEAPAEDPAQAAPEEEASAPAGKGKLRRRTKVILALLLLLLVAVGAAAAFLHNRGVFDITDWEKTVDDSFTVVVYDKASAKGEAGFRVRLWNGAKQEWHSEVAFHDATYHKAVWSPNGRFVAVEFTDETALDRVYIIDINRLTSADLQLVLENYLERNEGYFDQTPLAGAPACRILQWLPDSTRILIAAEGVVDTNIDPDFGIEFASSWAFSIGADGQTDAAVYSSGDAQTVSGYFAYEVDFTDIENIVGFGQSSPESMKQKAEQLNASFQSMVIQAHYPMLTEIDIFYETALLELAQLPDSCTLSVYAYEEGASQNPFTLLGNGRQVLGQLSAENHMILNVRLDGTRAWLLVIPS